MHFVLQELDNSGEVGARGGVTGRMVIIRHTFPSAP